MTPNKVIGINEIKDFLNKRSDLKEVKDKITIKTRQYAKRQSTWARGQMKNWEKVNPKSLKHILKKYKIISVKLDLRAQLQLDWLNAKIIFRSRDCI